DIIILRKPHYLYGSNSEVKVEKYIERSRSTYFRSLVNGYQQCLSQKDGMNGSSQQYGEQVNAPMNNSYQNKLKTVETLQKEVSELKQLLISTRLQQDVETSNLEEKYSKELSLLNLEYEKMLKSCIRSQRLYMDLKQNFETIEEKNGQLKGWCESTDKEKSIMKQTYKNELKQLKQRYSTIWKKYNDFRKQKME
ncbi:unnamed protein product, partial [Didymodactylos carnosus]